MFGRRDISILAKILAVVVLCLGIATILTNLFETRLTRSALSRQSRQVAVSDLVILTQAYRAQERSLDTIVRNLAAEVTTRGLTDLRKRDELDAQLGTSYRERQLDLLEILDRDGGHPVPAASTLSLRDLPDTTDLGSFDLASRLLLATNGTYVQTVVTSVGPANDRLVLAGGFAFGDAFAYRLRGQVGNLGEIVLVASGKVAGTTLSKRPTAPPGAPAEGPLPTSPTVVRVSGTNRLVVYAPVVSDYFGSGGGLGVALANPAAVLDRSLAGSRVESSIILGVVALITCWLMFRTIIRPLVGLSDTATCIAGGDLDATFDVRGRDEIAKLGRSLAKMTAELRTQADRVVETSRRIVTAQDDERHRIERNLHDGAQQRLLTASLAVGVAMAGTAAGEDAELAANLDEVARHLDMALGELRVLARGIHPSILSEEGLGPALESLVEISAIPATVEQGFIDRLPAPIEATAYFIVSEAIVNATKHGHCSAVHIRATRRDGHLVVEVSDDGVGGADSSRGSGLTGLADRVVALGGRLTVTSPLGQGTRIVAELPCE